MKPLTRGQKIIAFAERYLRVPEGALVGQPLKLEDFQKEFIFNVYDNKKITKKAILSIARKNGKTGLIAVLLLAHLIGPEAKRNTQIVSGAMSREQAALVFELACKMIMQSPELGKLIRIVPSSKKLIGLPMNVEFKALSAEGKTAHGLSPILIIMDELGQVVGTKNDFYDALVTAQGAHENPLQIIISTQAPNDSDLLSILIDDALNGNDPHTVVALYAADKDADITDQAQWYKANPALGKFRSFDDLKSKVDEATRMPSFESTVRNLYLNQRVSANDPFISRNAWQACAGEVVPIEQCTEIYGGLDLSGRTDLTAFVLYGLHDGLWNTYVYAWTPEKGLLERSKRDRTPYDAWVKMGILRTTPSATIDYDFIAHELAEITAGVTITAIAYDRWRMEILKKELEKIGLELPLVEYGQGFKDMSPALDAIESKILNGTLRHGGNPVLTMCAANSMVTSDPAGNRKLDKMKTSGRIDAMVALAMAAGVAERMHEVEGDLDDFINNPIRF